MKQFFIKLVSLTIGLLLFVPAVSALVPDLFSDVHSDNPNYTAINDLKTRGIISGYPDGTFKPDQVVNRVEALKIILNSAKVDSTTFTRKASFSDISQTEWYAPFLNKAYDLGIVEGYTDGTFKPNQTVNLVENLKILLNTYKIDLSAVTTPSNMFADAFADQWYAKFVQYAKDKKLIEADAANKVYPAQGMTRGKLAEVAYRLITIREQGLDYFGQVKNPTAPAFDEQLPNTVWDGTLDINITGFKFVKSNLLVPQGAKVRWTNNDSVNHQIVSDTSGVFSSAVLKPGDTFVTTFNDLGTFSYHCSIHPSMTGTIDVKPAQQVPTI
jgi:plastocyanin